MAGIESCDVVAPPTESFEVVAGRMSRILGACGLDTLGAAVTECLEELGRHTGADVAFVVLADDGERVDDDWRWTRGDRTLAAPEPGSPLRDTFGSVTEILRLGHTVAVDDISMVDLAPSERALATANGLRSIVLAPVKLGSTLLGLTGLQVLDRPHHWDRATLAHVELVAELLVKAVIRTRDRGALAVADARARRIAEFLPDGLLLLDPTGTINFASPSFARSSGVPAPELVGTPLAAHAHPDDRDALAAAVCGASDTGSGLVVRMVAGDGWRWSELSWQLVHEAGSGVPDEVVVSIRDIHAKYEALEELAHAHERDALTGALDRRGLDRTVAELAAGATSIAVAFVDVDRFKAVNDSVGHDAGDAVLRTVADALAGALRRDDVVARIGGDEFCVISRCAAGLGESPAALGARLHEALRIALAGAAVAVTASIGVAGPGLAADAAALRAAADAAMYRAKRAGGDRVALAGSAAGGVPPAA